MVKRTQPESHLSRVCTSLAALLLATSAHAGTWGLQVHLTSVQLHERPLVPWNQGNDGFALRYSFSDAVALQAGHYRNEHSMPGYNFFTNYALAEYAPVQLGPWRLGAFAGAVSGDDKYTYGMRNGRCTVTSFTDVGVQPLAGGMARITSGRFNLTLRASTAGPTGIALEGGFIF